MAISRALFSGVSGLQNHSVMMDVIANNIANVNTFGYKTSRITFEETFAFILQGASRPPGGSGGINPMQLGIGSSIGSVDVLHTQGALESTGVSTDLAIQGTAFFITSDGQNQFFTRSGAFQFDSTGKLINPNNGYTVQGIGADTQGNLLQGAAIGDIKLPFGQKSPAKSTTSVSFTGNLNAGEKPKGTELRSQSIYAKELSGTTAAGSNSNIQNMLALNTDTGLATLLEGIAANTTTVNIIDGVDRNSDGLIDVEDSIAFTYVAINTDSNYDFNSLQDLVDGVNNVFGPTGFGTLTAAMDDDGVVTFTRTTLTNKLIITSTNSNLQRSLESANNDSLTVADSTTNEFSHVATGVDLVTNLRNAAGADIGLQVGDTITMDGRLGGNPIQTNNTLAIDINTDVDAYLEQVRRAFDITTGSVALSDEGKLIIKGDGGSANEITALNISAADAASAAVTNFNAIYDSTPNNYFLAQEAEDVTASASATVFDSLGQRHVMTLSFQKDAKVENKWSWQSTMAEPASPSGGESGIITFKTDGSLATFTFDGSATSFQFEPKTGALNPVSIRINVGDEGFFNGITQLGTDTSLVASDQDGFGLGELSQVSIDQEGRIEGQFTNGRNLLLAQLSVAAFNNPSGLLRVGDNSFQLSANSGVPIIGAAGTAVQSKIVPGALEQSNVDLSQEFTNMIIAQRGFQASARIITVGDQFLTEVVNLKT
ncbi:flagellar hook-basal body complex protein [candidate division KSB1 bacterium]